MEPIAHALRAAVAAAAGDVATAHEQLAEARRAARGTARRDRQLIEIAELLVREQPRRASGLAMEHLDEYPADAQVLERLLCSGR